MFKDYGVIVDAYIPRKSRAKSNSKFGFVRFRYRSEAELAIEKMNGTRSHNAILKVNMALYGRVRAVRCSEKLMWSPKKISSKEVKMGDQIVTSNFHIAQMGCSYRDVVSGSNLTESLGEKVEESSIKTMKEVVAIKARVAFLESEVARLQHTLTLFMSDGKLKKVADASFLVVEGQQMEEEIGRENGNTSTIIEGNQLEEVSGGDGRLASYDGDDISGVSVRRDREKFSVYEAAGSVSVTDENAGFFSGERWPAGRGDGSKSGVNEDRWSSWDFDMREEKAAEGCRYRKSQSSQKMKEVQKVVVKENAAAID